MPAHDWTRVDDGVFHALHFSWIARLSDRLNDSLLPEEYDALPEQHAGDSIPDLLTLRRREEHSLDTGRTGRSSSASTLLLTEALPHVDVVTDLSSSSYTRRRRTLSIRHVSDDSLVALIEIMSAGNKSSRHAFDQFIDKMLSALDHGVHLLIVDLHPRTARDPHGIHATITELLGAMVTGLDPAKPLSLVSYLASGERRGFAKQFAVGDPLADMPLFLGDIEYVNVPLEETYMDAFSHLPRHLRAILEAPR